MIDYGDLKLKTRDSDGAISMYEKALFLTKDIELASVAAMRLAKRSEQRNKMDKASEYYQKILKGNREYFIKKPAKSWATARKMAKNKAYLLGADIAKILLDDDSEEIEDIKERMLVTMAAWYYEAGKVDKAIKYYAQYLVDYKEEGEFLDRVQSAYDKAMFETDEDSDDQRLKKYDELIAKYNGEDIANKATYAKAEILYKQKKYSDVLLMQSEIEFLPEDIIQDGKYMITQSAIQMTQELLELVKQDDYQENSNNKKICKEVEDYRNNYDITTDKKYDNAQYICYKTLGKAQNAITLAKSYFGSDDIKIKLEWMLKAQKILKEQNSLKKMVKLTQDIIDTASMSGITKYDELVYDIFDAKIKQLIPKEKLIDYSDKILKKFPSNPKNREIYSELIKIAVANKDHLLSIAYSKKLIDLQKELHSNIYSPWVDFVYLQALMDSDKLKLAKKVSKEMMGEKFVGEDRLKLLYLRSNILTRTGWSNKAKPLLQECSDAVISSKWVGLCKESLKWVDEN
jgi:tetratricopeptide (TPR) repeat protein